jgi:hypothetical protein
MGAIFTGVVSVDALGPEDKPTNDLRGLKLVRPEKNDTPDPVGEALLASACCLFSAIVWLFYKVDKPAHLFLRPAPQLPGANNNYSQYWLTRRAAADSGQASV